MPPPLPGYTSQGVHASHGGYPSRVYMPPMVGVPQGVVYPAIPQGGVPGYTSGCTCLPTRYTTGCTRLPTVVPQGVHLSTQSSPLRVYTSLRRVLLLGLFPFHCWASSPLMVIPVSLLVDSSSLLFPSRFTVGEQF